MIDQADKLRKLVSSVNKDDDFKKKQRNIYSKSTRVIAVTSGKGGVGKTTFCINLALSMINLGYKVLIMDADIGFANVDVNLGIVPKHTIADIIYGNKTIDEILIDGPNQLKIVAGGSGIFELMNLDMETLNKLTYQVLSLENYVDYIIIDTGAGLSEVSLRFLKSAQEIIMLTTPEPPAITDCYALIKTLSRQDVKEFNIVINRVQDKREGYIVYKKLETVIKKFLKVKVNNYGYINDSKFVSKSIMQQKPFIINYPKTNISKNINNIALNVINNSFYQEEKSGFSEFMSRFRNFISKGGY
ncbi:MinD/ParA family protein [Abyssisolibacter fermentans]|uniref:MinD/ParA family protein n=1 Tax=Abyssisolibacter fermentans TaxID=1766203 RepID=UPI0008318107|nr:MinD/ParA family protein [Abyssisolibacter fermentans]